MSLSPIQRIILRNVERPGGDDLREVSESYRQKLIDLAMMEPPLVEVDADQVTIASAGRMALMDGSGG